MKGPAQHIVKKTFFFFLLSFILISNKSFTEEGSSWVNITPLSAVIMKDMSDWNKRCYGFYNAQASLMGTKTEERRNLMRMFSEKSILFIEPAVRFDAQLSGQSKEDQMLITFASANKYVEIYSDALYQGITTSDENEKKMHEIRTSMQMETCDSIKELSKIK